MMNKLKNIVLWILLCLALPSCQTLPQKPSSVYPPEKRATAQHTVAPGETLWRISKMYDVPLATILRANRLDDKAQVKMGQVISVPQATAPHQPITLFPSRKWKYIIIHHTAAEGSSLTFHQSHLAKGWDRGVGYHFVINNGHGEKPDGFVEITPRWLKQEDGAHCKASDMNTKGIGISLVGNFSEDRVSPAQMAALVDMVNTLRKYYRIPAKNILSHKQVRESNTECPGNNFPWKEFKKKLR